MHRYQAQPIRFSATHRSLLHGTFLLLWLSGVLWLLFHYFLQQAGEFGSAPHPAEIWWLRVHGLLVFAALLALGSVLPQHAKRAWELGKNRRSGLLIKSVFLWLAGSGYALYYFASDENAGWLPPLHWAVGVLLPLLLLWHIRQGRKRLVRVCK